VNFRAVGVFVGGEATVTPTNGKCGGLMGGNVGAFVD
jgi:hypothetical protein